MDRFMNLVPKHKGRPAIGEVFEAPARIVKNERWVSVFFDGERIAKIKGDDAVSQASIVLANARAEERAKVAAHNAALKARQDAEAAEAEARAAEALAKEAAERAAGEGSDSVQASEGSDSLTETQAEAPAPKPVSHVARRPVRPSRAKPKAPKE